MKRRQREAVVAALDSRLAAEGSWCGETHLQKSVFFLQEMLGVPTGFQFILYKYGPFSDELRTELGAMRSDGFLKLVPQPAPYGPKLHTTTAAERQLVARWPRTLEHYGAELDFVAKKLGRMGVGALERMATALWVSRELGSADETARAERINELKPHVSVEQAREALRHVASMEREAVSLSVTS
jgi:hypothetical protein